MSKKNFAEESESKEKYISILGIFETLILLLGAVCSVKSTIKPIKYTLDYLWCFGFPILGIVFVAIMIIFIRKRYVILIGMALIFIYIFVAGFGAIVCEVNYMRLKTVSYFKDKEVVLTVDDSTYKWDGKSVSYNPENMEYVDDSGSNGKTYTCKVSGDTYKHAIYSDTQQKDVYYLEISSSGTGIYLRLEQQ